MSVQKVRILTSGFTDSTNYMGKVKNKCVECELYYRLRVNNPYHKTAYCEVGSKSVNMISDKSIACENFKMRKSLESRLKE